MMPEPEEHGLASLVRAAAAGSAEARERLLAGELPGIRAYVRLRSGAELKAAESSSDLLQTVCREILESLGDLEWRGEREFRRWLAVKAEAKLIDRARYWRAEKRDARRQEAGADPDAMHSLAKTYSAFGRASQDAIAREELERVERAFEHLTPEQREVVVGSKLLGQSHADLAARLGKTEGATRVLLHRALAQLAELLGPGRDES